MNVDRSDPYVFGGVVVDGDGALDSCELEPAGHWYSEPLPPAPGQLEESVVFLGEIYTDTEAPMRPTSTISGRLWGAVSSLIGGGDGVG